MPTTWLNIAQLRTEKCELKEAQVAFLLAFKQSRKDQDLKATVEAFSGLLRLAGEALDENGILKWEFELGRFQRKHKQKCPPMVWYCKGLVARHRGSYLLAQRCMHRFIRGVKTKAKSKPEIVAKGWVAIAIIFLERNRLQRSEMLAKEILRRYESSNLKNINGMTYLLLGTIYERQNKYKKAQHWFRKAYARFLGDHDWFNVLYVLYGFARIARRQLRFSHAYWYLDLMEKATAGNEFGSLKREIGFERTRLQRDSIDLLIDTSNRGFKTRESGRVSLQKQEILMNILVALSHARRGLSKSELSRTVWKEDYQPLIHDNKLYYNINRLRKLIEPNVKKPRYLLRWKKGYRLAPGLRIQEIKEESR